MHPLLYAFAMLGKQAKARVSPCQMCFEGVLVAAGRIELPTYGL